LLLQESEELGDVQDEFENNRSTKISQKEVDELMQELFEAYELDQVSHSQHLVLSVTYELAQIASLSLANVPSLVHCNTSF
jgi:hypothetical protein